MLANIEIVPKILDYINAQRTVRLAESLKCSMCSIPWDIYRYRRYSVDL